MANNIKIERLNSLILREVAHILVHDYPNSEILSSISIHEVRTTNELSITKIYYYSSIISKEVTVADIKKELGKVVKDIRYKLSKKLDVYKTPKLIFEIDKALEHGNKINQILNDIKNNKTKSEK